MTKIATPEIRQKQIMDAAVTCFASKGYYETTMDDIVLESKLSKGSLYWHFKSKRELFRRLMEVWYGEFLEGMAHAISGEGSASKRLALIFQSLEESAAARPELVRAQIEFYTFAVRDQEFSAWFHRMYVDTIELLSSLIELAIEEGEFRRVDPAATARMLMAYMDGALLHREMLSHHSANTPGVAEMATTVIALLNKSENDDA